MATENDNAKIDIAETKMTSESLTLKDNFQMTEGTSEIRMIEN